MKDNIKMLLYQWVYRMVMLWPAKAGSRRLLLIKTDEIGDYLLFRHQLAAYRNSARFSNHRIILVGNKIFKPLFDAYDAGTVDEVIWVEKKRFRVSMRYRFGLLRKIRQTGAFTTINAVYTRSFRYDDLFAAVSSAPVRIAMNSHNALTTPLERWLTPKKIYSDLVDTGAETEFDAGRNAVFAEKILEKTCQAAVSVPAVPSIPAGISLPPAFFMIFPGSGLPEKKWSAENFARVARHLAAAYKLSPVIGGSTADAADGQAFRAAFGEPILDLTGKTSLPEFLAVLAKATCLVSVDTGSVHLAAAVGCPVFALFSGIHYGRFAPYPPSLASDFHAVYPDETNEMIRAGGEPDFQSVRVDLIKTISPEKLLATIDAFLPDIRNRRIQTIK